MKLALIRQRYTAYGGAERFVERARDALRINGATVTLVSREWTGRADEGVVICNPFYLGSIWRDWSFGRCACSRTSSGYDLVQSHERLPCAEIYRAGDGVHREWLAQRRRALGRLRRLGLALNPYHHYVLSAEKRLYASPRLKAVICNSYMVKAEIQRHFGLPDARLHVVYNGIDTAAFTPDRARQHRLAVRQHLAIPETAAVFLFVGSGYERKGLQQALLGLAHQPAPAHLVVIGKDKHEARYRRLAADLGLGPRVHFLGPREEVLPYYGAADACVLPTLYDPFPNVALEAMASGLPLITSTKCGAAEIVREGINGFVCDALDTTALAQGMARLAAGAPHMGHAARAAAEEFSLERMSNQLLSIYANLLSERQRS